MARTITIRFTSFRECPNCDGRGDDGAEWRPVECRRCKGRGKLVTGVEVEDSTTGKLPDDRFEFTATGEVYLLDFDEDEEIKVVKPPDGGGEEWRK